MGVRPGDYPVGSPQSRAAVRAILERKSARRKRQDIIIIIVSSIPRPRGNGITIGQWTEGEEGCLTRFSILPPGMTVEQSEEIVSRRQQDQIR